MFCVHQQQTQQTQISGNRPGPGAEPVDATSGGVRATDEDLRSEKAQVEVVPAEETQGTFSARPAEKVCTSGPAEETQGTFSAGLVCTSGTAEETRGILSAGLVCTSGPAEETQGTFSVGENQTMEDVFSEVQLLLVGTGPDCFILKVGLHTWGSV